MQHIRESKDQYYMDIAKSVSARSTCMRKHWGSVIVKNDEIISTGYNGASRGRKNCIQLDGCQRIKNNTPRGTNYSECRSVHSEMNAMISASRQEMLHSTLYVYGFDMETNDLVQNPDCCSFCKRMIINAGIDRVIFLNGIDTDETGDHYRMKYVNVDYWVDHDDTMSGHEGY